MNKIEFGDCREIMKRWIDEGVKINTCVTSPPYYGLRDYGTATWEGGDINCDHKNAEINPLKVGGFTGERLRKENGSENKKYLKLKEQCPDCGAIKKDNQIGLEQTPKEYIENMVDVFNHVKELLADDGTLWVNIGDSYSSHKDCKSIGQTLAKGTNRENAHAMELGKSRVRDTKMLKSQGLKNKDLIGIPWMLAFALREAGWYLRQEDVYTRFCADYGVVAGRVIVNGGYGVPNANVSIFVPLDEPALEAPTDAVPDREVAVAAPETLAP